MVQPGAPGPNRRCRRPRMCARVVRGGSAGRGSAGRRGGRHLGFSRRHRRRRRLGGGAALRSDRFAHRRPGYGSVFLARLRRRRKRALPGNGRIHRDPRRRRYAGASRAGLWGFRRNGGRGAAPQRAGRAHGRREGNLAWRLHQTRRVVGCQSARTGRRAQRNALHHSRFSDRPGTVRESTRQRRRRTYEAGVGCRVGYRSGAIQERPHRGRAPRWLGRRRESVGGLAPSASRRASATGPVANSRARRDVGRARPRCERRLVGGDAANRAERDAGKHGRRSDR